jgi:hypothetical protein
MDDSPTVAINENLIDVLPLLILSQALSAMPSLLIGPPPMRWF